MLRTGLLRWHRNRLCAVLTLFTCWPCNCLNLNLHRCGLKTNHVSPSQAQILENDLSCHRRNDVDPEFYWLCSLFCRNLKDAFILLINVFKFPNQVTWTPGCEATDGFKQAIKNKYWKDLCDVLVFIPDFWCLFLTSQVRAAPVWRHSSPQRKYLRHAPFKAPRMRTWVRKLTPELRSQKNWVFF